MRGSDAESEPARALAEIDLIRRRVINVVGHELRTPVTTLRGLADQLQAATDPEERVLVAEALQRNAARVERLLDDLLVASGVATALPVGDPVTVAVGAALSTAWSSVAASGRDLRVSGPEDALALALPGSLERIFGHLLDNAVKHGSGAIEVRIAREDGRVVIEVESAGHEVPAADLLLAFELFYRGEGAVTAFPGLGIGLPVSRALARHHGGEVRLEPGGHGGALARLELQAP